MEPHKNKEWFFFSKREILWRMERVQRTRSGSLFTQTETIKMWRWQPQVNQNDLWSTFWAIWKSFGKVLAMTNQWRWLWISEVKFKKRLQLTVGLKWTLKILGIVKTPLLEYLLGEGGSKIDFKRRVLQLPKSGHKCTCQNLLWQGLWVQLRPPDQNSGEWEWECRWPPDQL